MNASGSDVSDKRAHLKHAIAHAAHYLPIQGPIGVFVHHNTLHAFEHLPFEEAVVEASRLYGTEPYMTEQQFRSAMAAGRIDEADIEAVLATEPNTDILTGRLDRRTLRKRMLSPGIPHVQPETIRWEIDEGIVARSEAERTLLHTAINRVQGDSPSRTRRLASRPYDDLIHPLLIRLTAAFLDQGLAYWPMPDRENGFYHAVRDLLARPGAILPEGLTELPAQFARQQHEEFSGEDAVLQALEDLGIDEDDFETFIQSELLALPGWAGIMRRLEQEPGLASHECVPCSLTDFLAVRLTMTSVASRRSTAPPANTTPPTDADSRRLGAAVRLFYVCRATGFSAADVVRVDEREMAALQQEIDAFDDLERRRVFQLAYERWHERSILAPLGRYRQQKELSHTTAPPFAQVFFCIDEREESMRRHLEEVAPDFETLGAAGYFGVAVNYEGLDDAHGSPYCPVVVRPKHAVQEVPVAEDENLHNRRKALRAIGARVRHNLSISSRTLVRGSFSTAVLGTFSLFPLVAHVLKPRLYSRFVEALNNWILPEPRTELTLMRRDGQGHAAAENLLLGFSPGEKADRVESVLRPAGLTSRFAPILVVLGHGSTSLNNPHESAHDCGACGGRRGGPNARLFAGMANSPRVRAILRERGIVIPETTWFIGGYHDTCSDDIEYFDLEQLPPALEPQFATVRERLDAAGKLEAHERSRRFEAARFDLTSDDALWHVKERSEHLAEPRPEYGHCTNAVCIVGRREITRGLFFDRRAFLVSYEPAGDDAGNGLARLLGAAIPVCAGINLEYYFSFVDNEGYGCGTKLPHNISGLVGVMNGHASDLRTGLPWQMVEIHEPVRILFVIETTPEILSTVLAGNPPLHQLVVNRWIRVATLDPNTGALHIYRDGRYEPWTDLADEIPVAPNSRQWYAGKREHLPVARIGQEQTA